MTRSPFSELRVNKMEDGKRRNAKGSKEVQIVFGADNDKSNRGESLQEAFKKFRKERQVCNALQVLIFKLVNFPLEEELRTVI